MSRDEPASNDLIPLSELPPCADGMSRRRFCAAAGTGLITLGLAACDAGGARISTGAIDDNGNGNTDPNGNGDSTDMANLGGSTDLAHGGGGSPDLAHGGGGMCSGTLNAGAASAITVGTAKHFSSNQYDLFVCRDANGLFTVDSACTHSGCTVRLQSGRWYCPCHGARFNFDGTGPTAPAFSPLPNYEVCVDASGNIIVDFNKTVSPTTRA
ncbi:MAG TPA: Rieske 2Fe-2S domain-containing protein [Polyangia bacterium]|nr:Rieske 2Fe-2S domain-containing protein [Polyangia bacterium]